MAEIDPPAPEEQGLPPEEDAASLEEIPEREGGFPFRRIDNIVEENFERLSTGSREIQEALDGVNFRYLLAANLMFSTGGDAYEPARIAALVSLAEKDPAMAQKIRELWGYREEQLQMWIEQWPLLEGFLADPRTNVETVQLYGNDVASLEALRATEVASLSAGMRNIDPERLGGITRTARLILAGKAEPWEKGFPNRPSVFGSINSMISCLEDLNLFARYPKVFQLANRATIIATGVASTMRYNNEELSRFMEELLVKKRLINENYIKDRQVQVTGRTKSLSSGLAKDFKGDADLRERIVTLTRTRNLEERDWRSTEAHFEALERLLEFAESQNDLEIQTFAKEFEWRRTISYDQRGCRILVQEPRDFDMIVRGLHRRTAAIRLGTFVATELEFPGEKGPQRGYLRGYRYNGEKIIPEVLPWNPKEREPAAVALEYIEETPSGEMRYGGVYHNVGPVWGVEVPGKKVTIILETQVRLGIKGMEGMRNAAYLTHRYGGDYTEAGLTRNFAEVARLDAKTEASALREGHAPQKRSVINYLLGKY